jgi:3-oxoadipate enol-lactonase
MLGVDVLGSGPHRVIVLNDWLCDTSTWNPVHPFLDREALTWAFADLRGYGRSRGQRGAFSLEEASADVIALGDHLGWDRFTVVGHSMSTLVALHLGQSWPKRIERLVLVTPPPPTGFSYDEATHAALREVALGDDARRAKALEVMIGHRLGVGWLRFKVERWRATADSEAVASYIAMFGVRGLPDTETPVSCAVLAITGEQDASPMRREAATRSLSSLCPKLTIASIVESGHYPMQETPPLFVATLQRFVKI